MLFSGGKDSAYSVYLLQQQGWNVVCLLTVITRVEGSYMFHHPNTRWTSLQSEAMGISLKTVECDAEENRELDDLEELMKREDVDGFVSGAIASDYQWSRINAICHGLGQPLYSPLWRKPQRAVLEDMLDAGFRILVVGTYAQGLDESWLGREVTGEALDELAELSRRHGISVSGEGGELETFVIGGPNFTGTIIVDEAERSVSRDSGTYEIKRATLRPK